MDAKFNVDPSLLDLTAGLSEYKIQYRGEKIIYKEGTTDLLIRFNSPFAPQITVKPKDEWVIPFDEFYITASAKAETITLFLISDRNIGVQAQTINVDNVTSIVNPVNVSDRAARQLGQLNDLLKIGGTVQTGYDLLGHLQKYFDPSFGTEIKKNAFSANNTVTIHTVTAAKTFILELATFVLTNTAPGANGALFISNDLDVAQYYIFNVVGQPAASTPKAITGKILISAGWKIKLSSNATAVEADAFIKGREI